MHMTAATLGLAAATFLASAVREIVRRREGGGLLI